MRVGALAGTEPCCKSCPAGYFQSSAGENRCAHCPDGTYSRAGSRSCDGSLLETKESVASSCQATLCDGSVACITYDSRALYCSNTGCQVSQDVPIGRTACPEVGDIRREWMSDWNASALGGAGESFTLGRLLPDSCAGDDCVQAVPVTSCVR